MDAMFAMGANKSDVPLGRYVKQIKTRSSEMLYGEDHVIVLRQVKDKCFLGMEPCGFGWERAMLDNPDTEDIERNEAKAEVARLRRDGMSLRQIEKETGVPFKTVSRWLNNN